MKKLIFLILATLFLSVAINAQTPTPTPAEKMSTPKKPIFRANKEQVMQVQKMLKVTETGKMDDAFRDEIKMHETL